MNPYSESQKPEFCPVKNTDTIVIFIHGIVEGPAQFKDLMKLDNPATRADLVSKFLPYITPKYSSTTISADSERPMAEEERPVKILPVVAETSGSIIHVPK